MKLSVSGIPPLTCAWSKSAKIQLPCAEWKVLFACPAVLLETVHLFYYFQAYALLKVGTAGAIGKAALWHQCHYFSLSLASSCKC